MSKETILAKIQSNLAGQGSQIDISGKLPEILAEIIELIPESGGGVEPYFVQGAQLDTETYASTAIVVSQEEFARAKAAFLAGRPVIIPEIDALAYLAVGYSGDIFSIEGEDTPIEGLALDNKSSGVVSIQGNATALIATRS